MPRCPWGPSPLRPPSHSLALRPLMGNAKPWEADRFSGAGPAFFDTTGMQRRGRGWWIMSISALKMIHIDSPCYSNKIWCKPVKLSEIDFFLSFPDMQNVPVVSETISLTLLPLIGKVRLLPSRRRCTGSPGPVVFIILMWWEVNHEVDQIPKKISKNTTYQNISKQRIRNARNISE